MASFQDLIQDQKQKRAVWEQRRGIYRPLRADILYKELVNGMAAEEQEVTFTSLSLSHVACDGEDNCHTFKFNTREDLEFFKDFFQTQSKGGVTCNIQRAYLFLPGLELQCKRTA